MLALGTDVKLKVGYTKDLPEYCCELGNRWLSDRHTSTMSMLGVGAWRC
jgi:hypothetical protein